jgi:hypothetical protein
LGGHALPFIRGTGPSSLPSVCECPRISCRAEPGLRKFEADSEVRIISSLAHVRCPEAGASFASSSGASLGLVGRGFASRRRSSLSLASSSILKTGPTWGGVLPARAAVGAWTAAGALEGEVALPSSATMAGRGPASAPSARAAPSFRTGWSKSVGSPRLSKVAAGSTLAPSWSSATAMVVSA